MPAVALSHLEPFLDKRCLGRWIVSIFKNTSGLLTVATRPVDAVHSSVLCFPVRKLQRGVQTPKAFSQGVVFVVFDQLLDTNTHTHRQLFEFVFNKTEMHINECFFLALSSKLMTYYAKAPVAAGFTM